MQHYVYLLKLGKYFTSTDFSDASLEEQDGKETNGRDGDPIIESFRTQLEDANRAMKGEQPKESFHFEVDQ